LESAVLKTSRLLLRPFHEEDIDPLYEIQGNRDAMRHTFQAASREAAERNLRRYAESAARNGFAPWTAVLQSEDRVIGWGGLSIDPFDPGWGIEVSYFFHPNYWGQGFATELVLAALDHGFRSLRLDLIGAFARPENLASIRVLEKSGFRFLHYEPKLERNRYEVARKGWNAKGGPVGRTLLD